MNKAQEGYVIAKQDGKISLFITPHSGIEYQHFTLPADWPLFALYLDKYIAFHNRQIPKEGEYWKIEGPYKEKVVFIIETRGRIIYFKDLKGNEGWLDIDEFTGPVPDEEIAFHTKPEPKVGEYWNHVHFGTLFIAEIKGRLAHTKDINGRVDWCRFENFTVKATPEEISEFNRKYAENPEPKAGEYWQIVGKTVKIHENKKGARAIVKYSNGDCLVIDSKKDLERPATPEEIAEYERKKEEPKEGEYWVFRSPENRKVVRRIRKIVNWAFPDECPNIEYSCLLPSGEPTVFKPNDAVRPATPEEIRKFEETSLITEAKRLYPKGTKVRCLYDGRECKVDWLDYTSGDDPGIWASGLPDGNIYIYDERTTFWAEKVEEEDKESDSDKIFKEWWEANKNETPPYRELIKTKKRLANKSLRVRELEETLKEAQKVIEQGIKDHFKPNNFNFWAMSTSKEITELLNKDK